MVCLATSLLSYEIYISLESYIERHIHNHMSKFTQALGLTAVTIFALWAAGAFHIIESGHIGVYKRGGAILNAWTEPGLHFMIPFITKVSAILLSIIKCK